MVDAIRIMRGTTGRSVCKSAPQRIGHMYGARRPIQRYDRISIPSTKENHEVALMMIRRDVMDYGSWAVWSTGIQDPFGQVVNDKERRFQVDGSGGPGAGGAGGSNANNQ